MASVYIAYIMFSDFGAVRVRWGRKYWRFEERRERRWERELDR